jgi:hypothetical protein
MDPSKRRPAVPRFKITGKGVKTGRQRTRVYQALDENTARAMAAKDGTQPEVVEMEPVPMAAPPLIKEAQAINALLPQQPSHLDCIQAMMERAIEAGLPLQVTMGTAFDDAMEERPWVGRIEPDKIILSAHGLRVRAKVTPSHRYLVTDESQRPGTRHLLMESIDFATADLSH